MSKKTLLNESTVRKFMKFANLGGLAENFVSENYAEEVVEEAAHEDEEVVEEATIEEEETMEEGAYMEDEHGMEAMDDDVPVDDAPADDLGAEEEAMTDTSEASVEAFVDAFADTNTQVTGVEVTATDAAPEAELPGDEGPVDDMADAPMGDEAPMDDEAPVGGEEEVLDEEAPALDEEAVMAETLRRVSSRLNEMKKKSDMIERLADRIIGRITEKK